MFANVPAKKTIGLGLLALAGVATAVYATPPSGVTGEILANSALKTDNFINHDRVKFQNKGPATVRVQRLTFQPGGSTGWHNHPGLVIVAVASGSITLRDSNCGSSTTYGPGSPAGASFIEGHDDAHEAHSSTGAVVYATYVDPSSLFRIDRPAAC